MKRMITLILAVAMLASALSITAFAAIRRTGFYKGKSWDASFYYSTSSGSASLSYEGTNDLYVCGVGKFRNASGKEVIVSPKTVTDKRKVQTTAAGKDGCYTMVYYSAVYGIDSKDVWVMSRTVTK